MTPEVLEQSAPDTPVEETGSLSDHEQAFGPNAVEPPAIPEDTPDDEPVAASEPTPRGRHKAASQRATAADVPIIADLTKQLREAEEAAGIVRKDGESQRVFELRRRVEMATALRDLRKAAAPSTAAVTPPTRPAPPTAPPPSNAFTEPEPKLEDFRDKDDPYLALSRAAASWDRRKEAFDAQQQQTQTQTAEQVKAADEGFVKWATETASAHDARLQQFVASNPKAKEIFDGVMARNDVDLSPVTLVAIHTSDLGPQMMLALAQNPELADDLLRESVNQVAFDARHQVNPLVAFQQRRLARAVQTLQAGTTGSAAGSRPVTVAPRPPNPVRTVPQTPSEREPSDDAPLSEHERLYGPKRRR